MGESGTPPSLNRYLYGYSNPTVYVDLFGYAALATGLDIENYQKDFYVETKNQFKFTKRFSEARGLSRKIRTKNGFFGLASSEALDTLYAKLDEFGVTESNAPLRAFLLVEQGDSRESIRKYIIEQMGDRFGVEYASNIDLKKAFNHRFNQKTIKSGALIDVSDFWAFSAISADDHAAKNSTTYNYYRKNTIPFFSFFTNWVSDYARNYQGTFDDASPPRLQSYYARSLGINIAMDAPMALEGTGVLSRGMGLNARLSAMSYTGSQGAIKFFRNLWRGAEGTLANESGSTRIFTDWSKAPKSVTIPKNIKSYKQLQKELREAGLSKEYEAHKLVEKRHKIGNYRESPAVPLKKGHGGHQDITTKLRKDLPYGQKHSTDSVQQSIQDTYTDQDWLNAAKDWIDSN